MATYTSKQNLLETFGVDSPERLNYALYKSTACGVNATLDDDGLQISSIVESSDVELSCDFLAFPFTSEQLQNAIDGIEEEADFYWRRDNLCDYVVTNMETGETWGFTFESADDVPDGPAKEQVLRFLHSDRCFEMGEGESCEILWPFSIHCVDKSMMLYESSQPFKQPTIQPTTRPMEQELQITITASVNADLSRDALEELMHFGIALPGEFELQGMDLAEESEIYNSPTLEEAFLKGAAWQKEAMENDDAYLDKTIEPELARSWISNFSK